MGIKRGRPEKKPEDRRTASMKLPLTESEKQIIVDGAAVDDTKPVTWARELLLKSAQRRLKR